MNYLYLNVEFVQAATNPMQLLLLRKVYNLARECCDTTYFESNFSHQILTSKLRPPLFRNKLRVMFISRC